MKKILGIGGTILLSFMIYFKVLQKEEPQNWFFISRLALIVFFILLLIYFFGKKK
jgi:heme O synthase-like polyprenyltransferase